MQITFLSCCIFMYFASSVEYRGQISDFQRSQNGKMCDLEWPVIKIVNDIHGALCWLWRQMRPRVDKVAMFSVGLHWSYRLYRFHYRLIVKFDTYQNLQLHRAVLPAIARLSCLACRDQRYRYCIVCNSVLHFCRKSAFRPFKVIQGHWFWYKSKARNATSC